jgi:hypothetical protein
MGRRNESARGEEVNVHLMRGAGRPAEASPSTMGFREASAAEAREASSITCGGGCREFKGWKGLEGRRLSHPEFPLFLPTNDIDVMISYSCVSNGSYLVRGSTGGNNPTGGGPSGPGRPVETANTRHSSDHFQIYRDVDVRSGSSI